MATSPSLELLAATRDDIPRFTEIYLASFSDKLSHACFPRSSPATRSWWTDSNASEFEQTTAHYLKVVDSSVPENPILVAYGKWNTPVVKDGRLHAGGDDPDEIPVWPDGGDKELATEFFGELARRRQAIMGERPHCYLEIVATLPQHQRRGAAARVMQWGCDWADREGLECYLEAGPDLVLFYARYGFQVVESFAPPRMPDHTESFMIRKPQMHQ